MDRVITARILVAELVAGEAEDEEFVGVFGGDGLVEFLQAFELRRKATFGGGVHDQYGLAFEGGKIIWFAFL